MSTLCIVMAHHGTEETCWRHLPFWRAHTSEVVFFCPADSVISGVGDTEQIWKAGYASHAGPMAIDRFRRMLGMAVNTGHSHFLIHEYDSIHFGPLPICDGFLGANRFGDDRPERGFKGTQYLHPPLMMSAEILRRVHDGFCRIENSAEGGFWDRVLGLICELDHIPVFDFMTAGIGFSHNTIEPGMYESAVEAFKNGAILFHGMKHDALFRRFIQ